MNSKHDHSCKKREKTKYRHVESIQYNNCRISLQNFMHPLSTEQVPLLKKSLFKNLSLASGRLT